MKSFYIKIYCILGVFLLLGFGCSTKSSDGTFDQIELNKIGFTVEIPNNWEESVLTADPEGPADFHEFVAPIGEQGKDIVAGIIGIRLVPRIEENELEDEVEQFKPFVSETAGDGGVFDANFETQIAGQRAIQIKWTGTTQNEVEEVWYYSLAFMGDDLLIVYFFDETQDSLKYKEIYDNVLTSINKIINQEDL